MLESSEEILYRKLDFRRKEKCKEIQRFTYNKDLLCNHVLLPYIVALPLYFSHILLPFQIVLMNIRAHYLKCRSTKVVSLPYRDSDGFRGDGTRRLTSSSRRERILTSGVGPRFLKFKPGFGCKTAFFISRRYPRTCIYICLCRSAIAISRAHVGGL